MSLFHSPASIHPPGHKNGGKKPWKASPMVAFHIFDFDLPLGCFEEVFLEQKDRFLWPVVRCFFRKMVKKKWGGNDVDMYT